MSCGGGKFFQGGGKIPFDPHPMAGPDYDNVVTSEGDVLFFDTLQVIHIAKNNSFFNG